MAYTSRKMLLIHSLHWSPGQCPGRMTKLVYGVLANEKTVLTILRVNLTLNVSSRPGVFQVLKIETMTI